MEQHEEVYEGNFVKLTNMIVNVLQGKVSVNTSDNTEIIQFNQTLRCSNWWKLQRVSDEFCSSRKSPSTTLYAHVPPDVRHTMAEDGMYAL